MDSKPTEEELLKLVGDHCDAKWDEFGIRLGITHNVCQGVRREKLGITKDCFILLCGKWFREEEGTGHKSRTWRTVIEAVRECGYHHVAEQAEVYLKSKQYQRGV